MGREKRRSVEEQEQLVRECRASGLSDRAWCLREGIKPGTFYNWVNRLKLRTGAETVPIAVPERQPEPQDVVRIDIVEETGGMELTAPVRENDVAKDRPAQAGAVMEIAVGAMRIRLTNDVAPELLARMLRELR